MNIKENPAGLKYARTHEWISASGDTSRGSSKGTGVCGITDHAQRLLTDIVFVELPEPGRVVKAGERVAVVESVKSVSDIYAPVSGEITEVNARLKDAPELVNGDAFGEGWLFKIALDDEKDLDRLLSKAEYEKLIQGAAS